MIVRFTKKLLFQPHPSYKFASAAAAAIDYYSLLGLERGATKAEVLQAFQKLTRNVNAENNSALFNRLTQAFVILTDVRARDAYDSLMKVRKFSFINQPITPPVVNSYITDRKAEKNKQFEKKYNLDKFGRYKGGLPRRNQENIRGTALGPIGVLHNANDQAETDTYPEFSKVDDQVAQSFKNFHQDQREHRTVRKTWLSFEVDYKFFTIRNFLDQFTTLKYLIFFALILPTIASFYISFGKKYIWTSTQLKKKREAEKAKQRLQKKEAQQKKAKEQQEKNGNVEVAAAANS